MHLPGWLDAAAQRALAAAVERVVAAAPLYRPTMPRSGRPFSIEMTNCGALGWVSDRNGYRYEARHPVSGLPWPAMPDLALEAWRALSGYPVDPEACLVNHYRAGTKMGSHVDSDEQDFSAPILSISLGDEAVFHVGGLSRTDPKRRLVLRSGDIVLLGGEARRVYHGLDRINSGSSDVVARGGRFNLTLRRVTLPSSVMTEKSVV